MCIKERKIGTAVVGLSVLGFGIFGVADGNGGGSPVYNHGDVPAPKLETHADLSKASSVIVQYSHAETW